MLSYGGYPTIVPSNELAGWIGQNIWPSHAFEFPRLKKLHGDRPSNVFGQLVDIRLNILHYPWGSSRWAHCGLLLDDETLGLVRDDAYAGDVYQSLPLVFDDDDGRQVETDMWMLPPVPLSKFDFEDPAVQALTNELWFLPLVDDRYWWWERQAAVVIDEGTTTWADLYATIALGLGVSLTAEAVPSGYLKPGVGLSRYYDYLPILLDCVASSVGHRIVRAYDGTFLAMSATTALAIAAETAILGNKRAGGALQLGVVDDA